MKILALTSLSIIVLAQTACQEVVARQNTLTPKDSGTRKVAVSRAIQVTDQNFRQIVTNRKGVTLVDFYADWCGPCRKMAPMIDAMAGTYAGRAQIAKLNVDKNPRVANFFRVKALPTLMIFKDGVVVDSIRGAVAPKTLEARLNRHL